MCSFESKWLRDCPNDFKPVFYRRYIDDIFVLFSSPDHADKFREYLSSKHPNLKFSIQKEEDGCLPLSGIKVSEYPFKEKRNTLRNIQVLLYTHFYNISLNILRPNFFNIYNLPILHFPNIGKIRVRVGPKLTTFPTL